MADWMKNTVESTLGPAKATRQVRIETRTPTGGRTFTYNDGGWSYCNIAPMSVRELDLAGRMGVEGSVSCRISADLDIDQTDRVRIEDSGADEMDGIWEVTAVLTGHPFVDRLLFLTRAE